MELKLIFKDVKVLCRDRCNRLAQCLFEGQSIGIFTEAPASPISFSLSEYYCAADRVTTFPIL